MASNVTTPSSSSFKGPTAKEVAIAGGVWAPSNAKRDKLVELRGALLEHQETLDDAATLEEQYDLWLADGLLAIVRQADEGVVESSLQHTDELEEWLTQRAKELPQELDREQYNEHLEEISSHLAGMAMAIPAERCLRHVRDFFEYKGNQPLPSLEHAVDDSFQECVARHRLGLAQAAADVLRDSWDTLVLVTDGNVDRAAVRGEVVEPKRRTLPLQELHNVVRAFANKSCKDRVEALWNLVGADHEYLLDQVEMNRVVRLAVSPVQAALHSLFQDALSAYPVRAAPQPLDTDNETSMPLPQGWRARRRETKAQRRLTKTFQNTTKSHFDVDLEMAHRLRCIYAWADKAHQNNKVDSVLVESNVGSVLASGRKRYVELEPKIALPEFAEMQREHFDHLDRVGVEFVQNFRDDLLVQQGKGRQNQELKRDCFLFLASVSIIDAVIMWL